MAPSLTPLVSKHRPGVQPFAKSRAALRQSSHQDQDAARKRGRALSRREDYLVVIRATGKG